jgi:tRNA threonylcarbamoyladenosine biosynthesis protein TsaB
VAEDREPRLLILETSGQAGQVALAEGGRLLDARALDEARRHARDLVPAVRDLLAAQGWSPRELSAVLVSRGPGSYTGLRVGVMSAKALAYATGRALLAIDTFAAIARRAPVPARTLDVVADAQQDKVYVQRFARAADGANLEAAGALAIRPVAEWLPSLSQGVWVSGPGLRKVAGRLPEGIEVVAADNWDPKPLALLEIGLARYRRGERDDLWAVEPLYLRPSSAEEQWARKRSEE